jgi:hypothetical protein
LGRIQYKLDYDFQQGQVCVLGAIFIGWGQSIYCFLVGGDGYSGGKFTRNGHVRNIWLLFFVTLLSEPFNTNALDPYVKLYLLPEKKKKVETKVGMIEKFSAPA